MSTPAPVPPGSSPPDGNNGDRYLSITEFQDWKVKALTKPPSDPTELKTFLEETFLLLNEANVEVHFRTAQSLMQLEILKLFDKVFQFEWVPTRDSYSETNFLDHILPTLRIFSRFHVLPGKLCVGLQQAFFKRLFESQEKLKDIMKRVIFTIKFLHNSETATKEVYESILLSLLVFKDALITFFQDDPVDTCDLREMGIRLVMMALHLEFETDAVDDREKARRDAKAIVTLFSLNDDIRIQSQGPLKINLSKTYLNMACPNDTNEYCPFEDWCCFKHQNEKQEEVMDRIQRDNGAAAKALQKKEDEASMIRRMRAERDRQIVEKCVERDIDPPFELMEKYYPMILKLREERKIQSNANKEVEPTVEAVVPEKEPHEDSRTISDVESVQVSDEGVEEQTEEPAEKSTEKSTEESFEESANEEPYFEARPPSEKPDPEPPAKVMEGEAVEIRDHVKDEHKEAEEPGAHTPENTDLTAVYESMRSFGISSTSPLRYNQTPGRPEKFETSSIVESELYRVERLLTNFESPDQQSVAEIDTSHENIIAQPQRQTQAPFATPFDTIDEEIPSLPPPLMPVVIYKRKAEQPTSFVNHLRQMPGAWPDSRSVSATSKYGTSIGSLRSDAGSDSGQDDAILHLECSHTAKRSAYRKGARRGGYRCSELVQKTAPGCKHMITVECWYDVENDPVFVCQICDFFS